LPSPWGVKLVRLGGSFALPLLLLSTLPAADWPQLFGPTHDGVCAETNLALPWPKDGPRIAWERAVGAGFSGPVVAGERLILFHRVDDNEVVECLNPATGKGRWKYSYATAYRDDFGFDEGPRATPVIAGEQVFTLGAEGVLHALDLEKGQKQWSHRLNDEYKVRKGFFGVATSPLVEGDLVVVNVGGREQKAGIVAFDRKTGKEIWRATDHEASYSSPTAATIDGVRHLLLFTREGLVSLDPQNGAVRFSKHWRARINASVNAATPLVLDGHVFVSTSYSTGAFVAKVKANGLEELWSNDESLSNHYNTSVRVGDYLFGLDGRQESGVELRCVEWKTGKVRWGQPRFGCATLVHVGEQLLALTELGELVLFDATPAAYRERARAKILDKPTRAAFAIADGRLFARDEKQLRAIDLRSR
jgi:outer membrane protein assembly factor BamB